MKINRPHLPENIKKNLLIWESYARRWDSLKIEPEDPTIGEEGRQLSILGGEWGTQDSVRDVIAQYIEPYITPKSSIAELGCGAGRIAVQVADKVNDMLCVDISHAMLERCKANLGHCTNITFHNLLGEPLLPKFSQCFDFIYSFDVFVHLDLHTMWTTLSAMKSMLRANGRVFLHTANLLTQEGWNRFQAQHDYSPEGFYFVSPDLIRQLLSKAGFTITVQSTDASCGFYQERDYLVVAVLSS